MAWPQQQQQRSHVPKFGNWENNINTTYTTCFEDARNNKLGVRMNPNDPEENPEAFPYANMANKRHNDNKIGTPESTSDRPRGAGHRRLKSDQKKSLTLNEGGGSNNNNSSSITPGHSRMKSTGSYSYSSSNKNHHRTPSVPKFGDWDATDPTSGEGFTFIFDKVKEEKQNPSPNFRPVPSQPSNYNTDGLGKKIKKKRREESDPILEVLHNYAGQFLSFFALVKKRYD
ncbi:hypothetical protein ACFE04_000453 [Oxalis oulophora]